MKASRLQSIIIIIRTCLALFVASFQTLRDALLHKITAQRIDRYFKEGSKKLLKFVKAKYKIYGADQLHFLPNRNYIVMCNHSSNYDIPLSAIAIPGSLRMIAKKELFRIPIFGRAMKKAGFISLDRKNREQAKKDLDYAKAQMQNGIIIWIAPEGTRSTTDDFLPFKKGGFMLAFQTDAIIIPIGIQYHNQIQPPKTATFYYHQSAEVHIGNPIDTKMYRIKDRQKLMDDVENSIRELANKHKHEK